MSLSAKLILAMGLTLGQSAPADLPPAQLAAKMEQAYGQYADISMEFLQSYLQKARGKTTFESGRLYAKRPKMLRWDYLAPHQKFFVSDGQTAYFYVVDDAQIIKDKNFSKNKLNSTLGFLWGEGQLGTTFIPAECQGDMPPVCPDGRYCQCLALTPRNPMPEVSSLRLAIDKENYQLYGIMMYDQLGNVTTYQFKNIVSNGGLVDDWFKFQVPEGVTVLEQGSK